MATLAGQPLYTAYGFRPVEEVEDTSTGIAIPVVRMRKAIERHLIAVRRRAVRTTARAAGTGTCPSRR